MTVASQMLLLLFVGTSISQDLLSPSVNIIAELEKIKNMQEKIVTLEETLNKLQGENEELKGLVQDLQKVNEAKKIAFSAGLLSSGSGHTGPVNHLQTLIYKKEFTNVGNAYNSDTGIFTAPVKGVYYFRFYAHSWAGTKVAISLIKNGQTQCSVFSYKPVTNTNASNGVVLTLEPGDTVYTQLWEKTWVYDDESSFTSFGGFLLFPL